MRTTAKQLYDFCLNTLEHSVNDRFRVGNQVDDRGQNLCYMKTIHCYWGWFSLVSISTFEKWLNSNVLFIVCVCLSTATLFETCHPTTGICRPPIRVNKFIKWSAQTDEQCIDGKCQCPSTSTLYVLKYKEQIIPYCKCKFVSLPLIIS